MSRDAEISAVDEVFAFIGDLENSAINWHLTAWINGIWLEADKLEFGDGIILRRPTPEDIGEKRRVDLAALGISFNVFGRPSTAAIMEFTWKAADQNDIHKRLDKVLDVLRLFNVGSVRANGYSISAHSYFRTLGGQRGPSLLPGGSHNFGIGPDDCDLLSRFFNVVVPALPDEWPEPSVVHPFGVALRRYRDALNGHGPIEGQIALAVSCLEALYLRAEERSELTHRLSQRAAIVLKAAGLNAIKAYGELVRAYDVRSTFIHGSAVSPDLTESVGKLLPVVLEYARISLAAFLQLRDHGTKDAFLKRIDNSLLDEKAKEKLTAELQEFILPGSRPE